MRKEHANEYIQWHEGAAYIKCAWKYMLKSCYHVRKIVLNVMLSMCTWLWRRSSWKILIKTLMKKIQLMNEI